MTDHDTRQIIIAYAAIMMVWSIACLLTIAFGAHLPPETVTLADPAGWLGDRLPCSAAWR